MDSGSDARVGPPFRPQYCEASKQCMRDLSEIPLKKSGEYWTLQCGQQGHRMVYFGSPHPGVWIGSTRGMTAIVAARMQAGESVSSSVMPPPESVLELSVESGIPPAEACNGEASPLPEVSCVVPHPAEVVFDSASANVAGHDEEEGEEEESEEEGEEEGDEEENCDTHIAVSAHQWQDGPDMNGLPFFATLKVY